MRTTDTEGNAIVYCEGAFGTTNGKTAHGLVRRSDRYLLLSVVDSRHAGRDAGELLDGQPSGIPIHADIQSAVEDAEQASMPATHLIIGLAPDGGRMSLPCRNGVIQGIRLGLNVVSGLHDFLCEDAQVVAFAEKHNVTLHDVRKTPPRHRLHAFRGKIEEVDSLKVAILGTDSAVGKRTTAWALVDGLNESRYTAELVGTGQTAWLQGARYSIILDSLINDFVAGEIEHAVWSAWDEVGPDVIVIEGQGSLMNPAYPGGHEILAAGRPDVVILQHAPARKEYDGFPGYRLHSVKKQIEGVELLSGRPVVAITLNHENLGDEELEIAAERLRASTGLPVCDVLRHGVRPLIDALIPYLKESEPPCKAAV
ncbi:MAG: hypothetical protein AMJ84_11710 [Acidithiobacillales bacterium SM23_46]|nr:MAG: hypothetical protein AMJ84_11710 [Acidithiobacillales bacterium SM23_46]